MRGLILDDFILQTAAFALPTLERLLFRPKRILAIRVLILTPTRELAVQ
jgi:ATP-dependent RNA helicase DDX27